jgi:hypothetical protein
MSVNTSKTFDDLEIRDTSNHTGDIVYNGNFIIKTIIVENGLDKVVNLQCEASMHADFSNSFQVGGDFDTTGGTNTYQSCDTYFPYWRMIAVCGTSPTTGALTVHVLGVA